MDRRSLSLDARTKRWLGVLALAALASVVVLARSFVNVFVPPLEQQEAKQSVPDDTQEVRASGPDLWSTNPEFLKTRERKSSASESRPTDVVSRKEQEAAAKEMVRTQAAELRAMVKQNRLPEGYGQLTLEQIDEMEKQGILIQ